MKYQHVILGGSGHVGHSLANELINKGFSVLIIGHQPKQKKEWRKKGADYKAVDILDSVALRHLFELGERLFILNPPAPPATDTVMIESNQVKSIANALTDLQLEKIVAASTYGAKPGNNIGDLGVLYELERALALKNTPVAIIRSAYYMSNWMTVLESVKEKGILPTMYPADFELPMVSPEDIGLFTSKLMIDETIGLHFIEGPKLYSPNDVAAVFSTLLNKPVKVASIPEKDWLKSLKNVGFSEQAAEYMVNMTRSTLEDKFNVSNPEYGETTLNEYFTKFVPLAKS